MLYEGRIPRRIAQSNSMPAGKGTYGKKRGRPAKKGSKKKKSMGLTAKQMKLPPALRKALMKKKRGGKKKK